MPGAGEPGDADEGVPREPDRDVLQVVLPGAVDDKFVGCHGSGHCYLANVPVRLGSVFRLSYSSPVAARGTRDLRALAGAIAVSAIGDWVAVIALGFRANEVWDGGVALLLICLWSPIAVVRRARRAPGRPRRDARPRVAAGVVSGCRRGRACIRVVAAGHPRARVHPGRGRGRLVGRGVRARSAARRLALARQGERPRRICTRHRLRGGACARGDRRGQRRHEATRCSPTPRRSCSSRRVLALLPVRRHAAPAGDTSRAPGTAYSSCFAGACSRSRSAPARSASSSCPLRSRPTSLRDRLARRRQARLRLRAHRLGGRDDRRVEPAVRHAFRPPRWPSATLIGAAVQGLAKFVAPFWQLYLVMLVAWAIGGMGHGIKNTRLSDADPPARRRRRTTEERSRRSTGCGTRRSSSALAGGAVLVSTIGGRGTLWVAGGVSAVAALGGVVALAATRDQPDAATANAS